MKKYRLNKKKFAAFLGSVLAAAAFLAVFVGGPLAILASI